MWAFLYTPNGREAGFIEEESDRLTASESDYQESDNLTARRVINSWSKSIAVQAWDFQSSWKTRSLAILTLEHFLIEGLLNLQSPTLQSILVGLFPLLWSKTDKACYCPFDIVYPLTVRRKSLYRICSKISYSMSHCKSPCFLSVMRHQRNQMTCIWKRSIIYQATSIIMKQPLRKVSLTERKSCLRI